MCDPLGNTLVHDSEKFVAVKDFFPKLTTQNYKGRNVRNEEVMKKIES